MQSFDPFAWTGATRTDLTEPLRYSAQRLSELLDPRAHFAAAASFTLDPVTAVGEFLELARAHSASGGKNPSFGVMVDGVERTRAVLVQDPNLAGWYGARHRAAVDALELAVDWSAATAVGSGKKLWLRNQASSAARGAVRDLWRVLGDSIGGYRRRLLKHISGVLGEPSLSTAEWLKFDAELRLIAAVAVSEGRTDSRLARTLARAIARAPDSAIAVQRVRAAFDSSAEPFIVALPLTGVQLARNVASFELRRIKPDKPRWSPTVRLDADTALVPFRKKCGGKSLLAAEVTAFDFEHAAGLAWQRAERLADQYGAEHRGYPIAVVEPLLVLRVSDESMSDQAAGERRVYAAKTRLAAPDTRFEQSLRYAALARAERAPVVQVLHSWIALETLARGTGAPMGPYQLLVHNLAPALAVHAVRQSLAATWHIASRAGRRGSNRDRWQELERWLGVLGTGRNLSDLNQWVDVMRHEPAPSTTAPTPLQPDASLDEAAAVFLDVLPTLAPFAREAILRWRWRLAVGNRVANWCDEVESRARAALGRMYVVRNSTVHTALTQAVGADQLAHAARNIVDAVYEVLPPWLLPNQPTWKAFERLARRANHVHRTWNHLSRPALINAESLTRPGGDGMTR